MTSSIKLSLLLVLLLPLSSFASLIKNGSFEDHSGTASNNILNGVDSTTISHWIVLTPGVELFKPAAFGLTPADGDWAVDLNFFKSTGGGIQQTLETVIGETYSFSFQAGTHKSSGRDGLGFIDVAIGADTFNFQLNNPKADVVWEFFSFEYTAVDTSTVLAFTNSTNSFDNFSYIDGVSGGIAVPEPSVLALMGIGLSGLGFARRRKQKV